ncbi:MAG: hypothetical protein H6732_05590 [Alphaproteobacteria bacterium]|nr:hypothetical protein [Alphaproteobacteria bacterium]
MGVRVFSEIGDLKRVLVHAPGPEVDTMLPEDMHRMLFDDILHGVRCRMEHRHFRAVLEAFGVEVVDLQDLLGEALQEAPEARGSLLDGVGATEWLPPERRALLEGLEPTALARALVEGMSPGGEGADELWREAPLPVPNLLFSRDAGAVIGEELVVSSMKAGVRQREPLLLRFAFAHHPSLAGTRVLADFSTPRPRSLTPTIAAPTIEGGDLLVLREGIVLIGIGERTMTAAADRLVERLRGHPHLRAAVLVFLPAARRVMHLDTVFTRASEHECLVYAPMICDGSLESVSAVTVELSDHAAPGRRYTSLLAALRSLGVDLEPLHCGGRASYVQQAREQWTDGANCFAIRPGVVVLYGRNRATAEELYEHGYEVVEVGGLPWDEHGRCLRSFKHGKRYALLLDGHELSRARGGPRCMTMPLERLDAGAPGVS